jgi:hypothetical protein
MVADGCLMGIVDGIAIANFIGKIPLLPSGIPPGASLCDTKVMALKLLLSRLNL